MSPHHQRTSGEPDVIELGNRRYRVRTEFRYYDALNGWVIRVPEGFECDKGSVPRIVWWKIAPDDLRERPCLLHDFLYDRGGDASWDERLSDGRVHHHHLVYTRKMADDLFWWDMYQQRVTPWKRRAAFVAVRLFGWKAWQG